MVVVEGGGAEPGEVRRHDARVVAGHAAVDLALKNTYFEFRHKIK